jgi:arylsulfatase A-like enzyme/cytochrome c-type biogenesis protein CcmH/NrfG
MSTVAYAAAAPNILLITLDTVRADRMGFMGSNRGLTPVLDALARKSVVFTRAYSQVPLTAPSHATILTGTFPQFNHVNDFQVPLAPDLPYAPDILRSHGYRTAAFIGAMVLDPKAQFAPDFDRGFDTYDAGFHSRHPGESRYVSTERRGGTVVGRALAWLDKRPKGPFFLWVHLYDAHHPYEPPEPFKSRYASAPYDGEIAYVDSVVGKFLAELRRRALYDNALIAVMADHGEALGEHGESTHGIFLYDETIQVPLMMKFPGGDSAGKRIESRVELVDVLPTILQTVGISVPPEVQGESLLSMVKTSSGGRNAPAEVVQTSSDRPAYAESDYTRRAFGWSPVRALRSGKYLYIQAPRPELYDQTSDRKAEHDLSSASTAVAGTLNGQLDAFHEKTMSKKDAPVAAADPEAQAKLAALGYVATDLNLAKMGSKDSGADPKDKIDIANKTSLANFLVEEEQFKEAVPLLKELIVQVPASPLPYAQLGRCYMALKQYVEALPVLRKIVALNPEMASAHFQLALALLASDDVAGAIPELEVVVEKSPRSEQAHLMLATAYSQTDRSWEAVTECEKILEFAPNHFGALMLEAQVLVESKQFQAAIPRLEKAAALQPKSSDPHALLAQAYSELGRKADAARERATAKRLSGGE